MTADSERFSRAIAAIDAEHADDPRRTTLDGENMAYELVYARRMSAWLDHLYPDASEALKLAVRAQHIRRWEVPRDAYAEGKTGYLQWRAHLKQRHAEVTATLLERSGYDSETIADVRAMITKRGLKANPDTQALEDVACMVFMEMVLEDFAARHEPEKVVEILRKTWRKMSPRGHAAALAMPMPDWLGPIVHRAIAPDPGQ